MKNKTTRNIKLQQVLSNLPLDTKLYLRDNDISSNSALVKLKPMERAHLVFLLATNDLILMDDLHLKSILNKEEIGMENAFFLIISFKKSSLCGSHCLYKKYCMLSGSMDFKTAVSILRYNK